jgi:hypothetical protein
VTAEVTNFEALQKASSSHLDLYYSEMVTYEFDYSRIGPDFWWWFIKWHIVEKTRNLKATNTTKTLSQRLFGVY